jgi:hypothetical protein
MMFAALEVLAGSVVLWIYAGYRVGGDFKEDAWKGYLIMAAIVIVAKLVLLLIMRHFRALYVLLALVISAGWAWVGFKLTPMIFDSPEAPLYGAGLVGVASLLEKFLQPQAYMEAFESRPTETAGQSFEKFVRYMVGKD